MTPKLSLKPRASGSGFDVGASWPTPLPTSVPYKSFNLVWTQVPATGPAIPPFASSVPYNSTSPTFGSDFETATGAVTNPGDSITLSVQTVDANNNVSPVVVSNAVVIPTPPPPMPNAPASVTATLINPGS